MSKEKPFTRLQETHRLIVAVGFFLAILLALSSNANEADREADMFGVLEEAATPSSQSSLSNAEEAAMFGETEADKEETKTVSPESETGISAPLYEERLISGLLREADKSLEIGGRLYMRLNYSILQDTNLGECPFSSPNLLDVYLDARPNDRVRGYVSGRLNANFANKEGDRDSLGNELKQISPALDQLWLKFDIARSLFLTLGKQPIKWGSGRFWNPTDFMNKQRIDPLALFDERLGIPLLKLHLPIESLGWNFYAIANFDGVSAPEEIGGAFRAEILVWQIEFALSAAARKDTPLLLGADITLGVWLLDFRFELALIKGDRTDYYEGELDFTKAVFPSSFSRQEEWIPQIMAGVEIEIPYAEEDSLFIGGEYFFNGAGYENANLYPVLLMNGIFTPLYTGKRYAGAYIMLMNPHTWNNTTFILTGLGNISDRSFMARFDYRVRILSYLDFNAHIGGYFGKKGEFRLGFEIPPLPVESLEEGLIVKPPMLDFGVGFLLRL